MNKKTAGSTRDAPLAAETREQVQRINARAVEHIDQRQARGNYLAQLRCLLTEEDQAHARREALDFEI